MKHIYRILIFFFVILSTKSYAQDYREVLLFGRSSLDTIRINVVEDIEVDSIIKYSYTTDYYSEPGNWEDTISLVFPLTSDTINNMWLSGSDLVYLSPTMYEVLRFTYDDPSGEDEEKSYFYCSGFGILVERSLAWYFHQRLWKTGISEDDAKILFLCEKIVSTRNFFHGR